MGKGTNRQPNSVNNEGAHEEEEEKENEKEKEKGPEANDASLG